MEELFSMYCFSDLFASVSYFVLRKECRDGVNNVCLLLEAMNLLLWEKLMIETVLEIFFCNTCLCNCIDFKFNIAFFYTKEMVLTLN